MEQLNRYEMEQENLNNDLKNSLRHLQKPFLKMQALATSGGGGGITPDELKMIGLYMENPYEAVTLEGPSCSSLKQILEKLSNFLEQDKLKLKSDKQRKAEQAVEEILKRDNIAALATKCVEVAAQKKQILSSPEMDEAKRSLNLIQQQIETLRARKSNIETDETMKENQYHDLQERNHNLKKSIETNVLSFMGKQIQLF
jgi:hypothetical protein